ncbi:unnamed protein product [Urochloa humidicola]
MASEGGQRRRRSASVTRGVGALAVPWLARGAAGAPARRRERRPRQPARGAAAAAHDSFWTKGVRPKIHQKPPLCSQPAPPPRARTPVQIGGRPIHSRCEFPRTPVQIDGAAVPSTDRPLLPSGSPLRVAEQGTKNSPSNPSPNPHMDLIRGVL